MTELEELKAEVNELMVEISDIDHRRRVDSRRRNELCVRVNTANAQINALEMQENPTSEAS